MNLKQLFLKKYTKQKLLLGMASHFLHHVFKNILFNSFLWNDGIE